MEILKKGREIEKKGKLLYLGVHWGFFVKFLF